MDDRFIGVFDSGIGGLTVLSELEKLLPQERFVFLADTNRAPYGEKTIEELYEIVEGNIEFLISKNVKMIVFACNTASTLDLDYLRSKYQLPIITVLEATVKEINKLDRKILVCATEAAINSNKHKELIEGEFPMVRVEGVACKDIVPSVEFKNLNKQQAQNVVDGYLKPYMTIDYDALVLGCTHYPIWEEEFKFAMPNVRLVNPAQMTAKMTKEIAKKHNILCNPAFLHTSENIYYVTSDLEQFIKKVERIFMKKIKNAEKVEIF